MQPDTDPEAQQLAAAEANYADQLKAANEFRAEYLAAEREYRQAKKENPVVTASLGRLTDQLTAMDAANAAERARLQAWRETRAARLAQAAAAQPEQVEEEQPTAFDENAIKAIDPPPGSTQWVTSTGTFASVMAVKAQQLREELDRTWLMHSSLEQLPTALDAEAPLSDNQREVVTRFVREIEAELAGILRTVTLRYGALHVEHTHDAATAFAYRAIAKVPARPAEDPVDRAALKRARTEMAEKAKSAKGKAPARNSGSGRSGPRPGFSAAGHRGASSSGHASPAGPMRRGVGAALSCHRCGQPGHMQRDCPSRNASG